MLYAIVTTRGSNLYAHLESSVVLQLFLGVTGALHEMWPPPTCLQRGFRRPHRDHDEA